MDQQVQTVGPRKYVGAIAEGYDAKRESSDKWKRENEIARKFLSVFPRSASVLDVPVGTGRFIPLYQELGFHVLGLDVSEDMLKEAGKKIMSDNIYLRQGSAIELDLPDRSYDAAVCVRLFRWISLPEVAKVLSELQRVSRHAIMFNARVCSHPYARPLPFLLEHIKAPWEIAAVESIETNFLMFMLGRA